MAAFRAEITWNPRMVYTSLGAFALALWFAYRIARKWAGWPFGRTVLVTVLGLLFFVPPIAMTGVVHQSAWLFREPFYVQDRDHLSNLKRASQKTYADSLLEVLSGVPSVDAPHTEHRHFSLVEGRDMDTVTVYSVDVRIPGEAVITEFASSRVVPAAEIPPRVRRLLWGQTLQERRSGGRYAR